MKRTKPKPTPEENFQHAIERPGTWFRFARRLLAHSLNEPTIEWGPLTEMIDSWARYRAEGLRRCVLLQGTPGTGKSTFARHAARRLSKRTVFMTSAGANNISASDWQLLLEMLAPQMVVIDDVDRLMDSTLEGNLRMFEEHHCQVPFIIFTSNDHAQLPRPMRRPGRIDQILPIPGAA